MSAWQRTTVEEIATGFLSGGTPTTKQPEYWQGNIPWITSKWLGDDLELNSGEKFVSEEAVKKTSTNIVPKDSIIFATRVGVGKVGINRLDLAINQDLAGILIDKENLDVKFIAYQLGIDSIQQYVAMNERGATIKGITRNCLKGIRLSLPPLPEQKKIAHVLSTVQRAIEAQERIIQTTTELKKALMHKLFTEGLRNEPQKQTEIGPIPESWEVRKLGDIAKTISKGSSPKWQGFQYTENGILFIRSQNVGNGKMLLEERAFLPAEFNEKEKRSVLQSGDILINLVGASIGRVALGTDEIDGGNCNQAVGFVRLDGSEFLKQLIVYFLLSPWGQEQMRRQKKDIARANLSLLDVKGFDIPLPQTEEEIREVASTLVTMEEKISTHEKKRDQLQDLFRTLLHELMTAKVRVHELNLVGAQIST